MGEAGPAQLAEILISKASDELRALEALLAADIADEVIGFHAQQIVEKSIKAVLVSRSVEYRFSHDLSYLNDLLAENGVEVPEALREAEVLRPWAMELRYEDPSRAGAVLDRGKAHHQARFAHDWAAGAVAGSPDD